MLNSDSTPPTPLQQPSSRPASPDSQLTNSLYRASATIDEFTATLAKISRTPSVDDAGLLHCCCGRDACENTNAWISFKNKLESRLILCAEVGQALLEKHEAYVRRHSTETQSDDGNVDYSCPETPTARYSQQESHLEARVAQLVKENSALEKRLNTALLNSEIAESSKKGILQELEEAKEAVSRLTVSQAKSAGWEARLSIITEEKDDLRQELDSERQRAKGAEGHVLSLKDRCANQQSELNRLYDELSQQKQTRTELSEEILRDARARLQMFQQQQLGHTVVSDSPEVAQVMESLVADNEALKRDTAELQNLLAEAREDVRVLREEVEETRTNSGGARKVSLDRPGHNHTFSWASSFGQVPISLNSRSAAQSAQPYEPLTPSTDARPLSPADSRAPSEKRFPARPKYPLSHLILDTDERGPRTKTPETAEKKSPRRPLFLLTQSRSIQTDDINWSNLLGPVLRTQTDDGSWATPPGDGRSDSSSLTDAQAHSSTIAALIDRTNSLFTRMAQADARTLTNRLKRQRLAGDVSHLSHATVSAILSEMNGLRAHFRGVLEDERAVSTCTRRDLRALLALLREMFVELGQMRVTLNDVVLDPASAPKISEVAMDPSKTLDEGRLRPSARRTNAVGSWMAPFSKLFGASAPSESKSVDRPPSGSSAANDGMRPKPPKFVPKSGPALAASTTTVNVEFSGAGVGRSVSNAQTTVANMEAKAIRSTTAPSAMSSRAVMDIFAGAPHAQGMDPWVLLPSTKPQGRLRHSSSVNLRTATLTRSAGRRAGARLSRKVDVVSDSESAVHDSDEEEGHDVYATLLERTLRPRGLSDSSIRSTFLNGEDNPLSPPRPPVSSPVLPSYASLHSGSSVPQDAFPGHGRPSVLQAFSRASTIPAPSSSSPPASSPASSRRIHLLPTFAQWAAVQAGLDAESAEDFAGSVQGRDDEPNFSHRSWQRDLQGRDI